jgi:phosphoribosylformylglycinamidine synthase
LQAEKNLHEAILSFRGKNILHSVHDISEGGLMVCLLESSFVNLLGFEISTDANIRKDAYLFGEAGGRIVVSISEENIADFEAQMKNFPNVPCVSIGKVKGYSANVDGENLGEIAALKEMYDTCLEKKLA